MMIAYREGEAEVRAALAVALGEGRKWAERGRWFEHDRARGCMVATDELIDLFLREVAECIWRFGADLPGFGRFTQKYSGDEDGRGALAGQWIRGRYRLRFERPAWGWNLEEAGERVIT